MRRTALAMGVLLVPMTGGGCRSLAGCDDAPEGPAAVVALDPTGRSTSLLLKHETFSVTVPTSRLGQVASTKPAVVHEFQAATTFAGRRTQYFETQAVGEADLRAT